MAKPEIAFVRTDKGQFFYDVVMSDKSSKYLAHKWRLPIADIRLQRDAGRAILYGTPSQRRQGNKLLRGKIDSLKSRGEKVRSELRRRARG